MTFQILEKVICNHHDYYTIIAGFGQGKVHDVNYCQ